LSELRLKIQHENKPKNEMFSVWSWNRVPVNKVFIEPDSPEPKVRVMIPMYEPLQTSKCEKCGKVIAETKELIRIVKESS